MGSMSAMRGNVRGLKHVQGRGRGFRGSGSGPKGKVQSLGMFGVWGVGSGPQALSTGMCFSVADNCEGLGFKVDSWVVEGWDLRAWLWFSA